VFDDASPTVRLMLDVAGRCSTMDLAGILNLRVTKGQLGAGETSDQQAPRYSTTTVPRNYARPYLTEAQTGIGIDDAYCGRGTHMHGKTIEIHRSGSSWCCITSELSGPRHTLARCHLTSWLGQSVN